MTVAEWSAGSLQFGAFFDWVSPQLDVSGNDNLPLIPPDRAGVSLEFTSDRLRANVDYVRASEQDDVAEFELPSDSYADLRAPFGWPQRRSSRGDVLQPKRRLSVLPPHLPRRQLHLDLRCHPSNPRRQ